MGGRCRAVDDGSRDRTVEIACELGIHTVVHTRNRGYGGNQKTCYREALARGADIVVMVHPDHQYDPKAIPQLVEPLAAGRRLGWKLFLDQYTRGFNLHYWHPA